MTMTTWREENRADKVAAARIQMEKEAAAAQRRISERSAAARDRRADKQALEEEKRAKVAERRARREAQRKLIGEWANEHAVDLMIYPLALVSAWLAVPSMAEYGSKVYGGANGVALPALTELGMWAFALSVQFSRRRTPDRPVWWLQVGMYTFAAGNVALNALHGAQERIDFAVVMGVCSVAGVVAHQFITAGKRRSKAERDEAKLREQQRRKVARIKRAAVREAVAEVYPDGRVELVYQDGLYTLTRFGRLESEEVDWDAELVALTAVESESGPVDPTSVDPESGSTDPTAVESDPTGVDEESGSIESGSVAILDRDFDLDESTPDRSADLHQSTPKRKRTNRKPSRSIAQLRTELRRAMKSGRVDPDKPSAESIRKALHCSASRARELRIDYLANRDGGTK